MSEDCLSFAANVDVRNPVEHAGHDCRETPSGGVANLQERALPLSERTGPDAQMRAAHRSGYRAWQQQSDEGPPHRFRELERAICAEEYRFREGPLFS